MRNPLPPVSVLIVGGVDVVKVTDRNISAATGIPFSYISAALVVSAVCLVFVTIYNTYKELRSD